MPSISQKPLSGVMGVSFSFRPLHIRVQAPVIVYCSEIAVPCIVRQNNANPTHSFELEIFAIDGKKTRDIKSGVPRKGKNDSGHSREENLRIEFR